jgi:hypothetical protein
VKIIQDAHAEISTRFRLNLNTRGEPKTTTAEPTPKDHKDAVNQRSLTTFSGAELSSERICQHPPQRSENVDSVDLAFEFQFHQTSNADSGYTNFGYKVDRSLEPFQASTRSIAGTDEEKGAPLANRSEMVTKSNVETKEIQDSPSHMNNQDNE